MSSLARLTARMHQLYEYDREPVEESALEPGRHFAGLFAGEHVAATEFVIGAFFVLRTPVVRRMVCRRGFLDR